MGVSGVVQIIFLHVRLQVLMICDTTHFTELKN